MNIQRLEMMRVMMERVVAGSWKPELDPTVIGRETSYTVTNDVAVAAFDLDSWACVVETKPNTRVNGRPVVCGFSACAVGHACFDEEFRKLGWSWNGSQPRFGGFGGLEAAQLFFGITRHQSERLFLPEEYSSYVRKDYTHLPKNIREAKMVADRIETLIDGGRI